MNLSALKDLDHGVGIDHTDHTDRTDHADHHLSDVCKIPALLLLCMRKLGPKM